MTGILADATSGSVVFAPNGGTAVRLARSSIRSLEWPLRQKRATAKGLALGGAIGAIAGALGGAASGEDCSGGGFLYCFSAGELALVGAVAFGGLGAVAGGAIGYFTHVAVWESEQRQGLSLTIAPSLTARQVGLVASLSF